MPTPRFMKKQHRLYDAPYDYWRAGSGLQVDTGPKADAGVQAAAPQPPAAHPAPPAHPAPAAPWSSATRSAPPSRRPPEFLATPTLTGDPVKVSYEVYEQIKATVGSYRPETGMMLGSSDGQVIDECYFDRKARTNCAAYSPNIAHLNNVVLPDWNSRGIQMVGFVHSHPRGCITPSFSDVNYAGQLLRVLPGLSRLVMPIVQSRASGQFSLRFFAVRLSSTNTPTLEACATRLVFLDPGREEPTAVALRTGEVYPRDVLARKTVLVAGCGGSGEYVEYLARIGVGRLILLDGDVYERANLETQKAYLDELGTSKPLALAARIKRIDPSIEVVAVPQFLDDTLEDDAITALIGQDILAERPTDVLIVGCTDDFYAQARLARLALNLGCPYAAAQLYAQGSAAEVIFTYPGVTPSCPRCLLARRYDLYQHKGYTNDTTSSQASIFSTQRANATLGFVTSMLLLYHQAPTSRFNDELEQVKDRNFILTRLDADFDLPPFSPLKECTGEKSGLAANAPDKCAGEKSSPEANAPKKCAGEKSSPDGSAPEGSDSDDNALDGSPYGFYDDSAWLPQVPDDGREGRPLCPECQGCQDLSTLVGTYEDTRLMTGKRIWPSAAAAKKPAWAKPPAGDKPPAWAKPPAPAAAAPAAAAPAAAAPAAAAPAPKAAPVTPTKAKERGFYAVD